MAKKSIREKVLYANPIKGATPRAYETVPNSDSKGHQKSRGTEVKLKAGKSL